MPPGEDALRHVTDSHRRANDALERSVGHLPTPIAVRVATVEVNDLQRLAVIREFRQVMVRGYGNCFEDLSAYEAEVRARIEAAKPRAAE